MRDDEQLKLQIIAAMQEWNSTHRSVRMWTYLQDSGKMLDPDAFVVAIGYSGGNEGQNPEGVNNHDMQNIKKVGPLPVGYYTFGEVVLKSHLGPFAIPLIPDKDNEMFGRSGFYVHGDTTPGGNASQGCIIIPRNIRELMYASTDRILRVKLSEVA